MRTSVRALYLTIMVFLLSALVFSSTTHAQTKYYVKSDIVIIHGVCSSCREMWHFSGTLYIGRPLTCYVDNKMITIPQGSAFPASGIIVNDGGTLRLLIGVKDLGTGTGSAMNPVEFGGRERIDMTIKLTPCIGWTNATLIGYTTLGEPTWIEIVNFSHLPLKLKVTRYNSTTLLVSLRTLRDELQHVLLLRFHGHVLTWGYGENGWLLIFANSSKFDEISTFRATWIGMQISSLPPGDYYYLSVHLKVVEVKPQEIVLPPITYPQQNVTSLQSATNVTNVTTVTPSVNVTAPVTNVTTVPGGEITIPIVIVNNETKPIVTVVTVEGPGTRDEHKIVVSPLETRVVVLTERAPSAPGIYEYKIVVRSENVTVFERAVKIVVTETRAETGERRGALEVIVSAVANIMRERKTWIALAVTALIIALVLAFVLRRRRKRRQ